MTNFRDVALEYIIASGKQYLAIAAIMEEHAEEIPAEVYALVMEAIQVIDTVAEDIAEATEAEFGEDVGNGARHGYH